MPINVHGKLDFPNNPTNNDLDVDDNDTQWRFNGVDWAIFEPYYIDELTDVDTSTNPPEVGDQLEWDGTNWVNVIESLELENLSDVNLTSPVNNDFLVWSGSEWINTTFVGHNKASIGISTFSIPATDLLIEIPFDTTNFTSDVNMVDLTNNRIIIQDDGLYYINISHSHAAVGYRRLTIYDSLGAIRKHFYLSRPEIFSNIETFINRILYYNLNAGDYLKFYGYVPSTVGGSIDIDDVVLTTLRISDKI